MFTMTYFKSGDEKYSYTFKKLWIDEKKLTIINYLFLDHISFHIYQIKIVELLNRKSNFIVLKIIFNL